MSKCLTSMMSASKQARKFPTLIPPLRHINKNYSVTKITLYELWEVVKDLQEPNVYTRSNVGKFWGIFTDPFFIPFLVYNSSWEGKAKSSGLEGTD